MKHTLIINTLIVLAVCFVIFSEHNPLALLALTFLLPFPMNAQPGFFSQRDDEDESRPIGFTADLVA
jgi:hypothetical protein